MLDIQIYLIHALALIISLVALCILMEIYIQRIHLIQFQIPSYNFVVEQLILVLYMGTLILDPLSNSWESLYFFFGIMRTNFAATYKDS